MNMIDMKKKIMALTFASAAMKKSRLIGYVATIVLLLPALALAAPQKVKVVNGENKPVPVYDVVKQEPYQWEQMNVEFVGLSATTSFFVPAGKRLVIEHVSGTALIDTEGEVVEFLVATTTNDMYATHRLSFFSIGSAGGFTKGYTVSQRMTLYADSNTDVVFYAHRNLPGLGAMHVSVSGYLVDLN